MDRINQRIATELGVGIAQVAATVELLGEGATVPFIARYRKEKTGGLDDTQLRKLEERLGYLRELEDRRATVLKSIEEQGKMTPELARSINGAETKVELEDLYAPYKPKRRTKAQIAREAGLEPLADALLTNPALAARCRSGKIHRCGKGRRRCQGRPRRRPPYPDRAHGRGAALVGTLREWEWGEGVLASKVTKNKTEEGAKFSDYFDFGQKVRDIPSAPRAGHAARPQRRRARSRPRRAARGRQAASRRSQDHGGVRHRRSRAGRPTNGWPKPPSWRGRRGMASALNADLLARLKERADAEAISVFSKNLKDLLLAAPAGPRATMGLDPGFRSGVKVAVVDQTGKVVDTATIYPHEPRNDWARLARDAGRAVHEAQGRSHQHRQRHRQPRDRQDGRRADRPRCPTSR